MQINKVNLLDQSCDCFLKKKLKVNLKQRTCISAFYFSTSLPTAEKLSRGEICMANFIPVTQSKSKTITRQMIVIPLIVFSDTIKWTCHDIYTQMVIHYILLRNDGHYLLVLWYYWCIRSYGPICSYIINHYSVCDFLYKTIKWCM